MQCCFTLDLQGWIMQMGVFLFVGSEWVINKTCRALQLARFTGTHGVTISVGVLCRSFNCDQNSCLVKMLFKKWPDAGFSSTSRSIPPLAVWLEISPSCVWPVSVLQPVISLYLCFTRPRHLVPLIISASSESMFHPSFVFFWSVALVTMYVSCCKGCAIPRCQQGLLS